MPEFPSWWRRKGGGVVDAGPDATQFESSSKFSPARVVVLLLVLLVTYVGNTAIRGQRAEREKSEAEGERILARLHPAAPLTTLPPTFDDAVDGWRAVDVAVACENRPTLVDEQNPVWFGIAHVVNDSRTMRSALVEVTLLDGTRPVRTLYGYAEDIAPHATAEVAIATYEACAAIPSRYAFKATTA